MRTPFHLVDLSPWPLSSGLSSFILFMNLILFSWHQGIKGLSFSFILSLSVSYQWWRDSVREGSLSGFHNKEVQQGLKMGSLLFILSEVMFFVSFFWGWSHSSLAPNSELGMLWPPQGSIVFNFSEIPFLNTLILVSSGVCLTWAHYNLMSFKKSFPLGLTLILGISFTFLQGYEYYHASYTLADSIYGSLFFLATGFHGLHVIIGSIFLSVCLIRYMNGQFSMFHHLGFESSCWYWHFVDVIWLSLYLSIYWWGS